MNVVNRVAGNLIKQLYFAVQASYIVHLHSHILCFKWVLWRYVMSEVTVHVRVYSEPSIGLYSHEPEPFRNSHLPNSCTVTLGQLNKGSAFQSTALNSAEYVDNYNRCQY